MKQIGRQALWSFLNTSTEIVKTGNSQVRRNHGCRVGSYSSLMRRVAELSYHNPEYVFFFRGQSKDWKSYGQSTIKPGIFRSEIGRQMPPALWKIGRRYDRLERAQELLLQQGFHGDERLKRYRILRWALIQHYQICETPFLDVTHSLRVAASFATLDHDGNPINCLSGQEPILCVFGLPNVAGSVTASSEQGVQIVRLSSICPPVASRPHFQEGYVLGEYPELTSMNEKSNYAPQEVDFNRRLIAKFRLNPTGFWSEHHHPVPPDALYPRRDGFSQIAENIKDQLGPEI
ncbi:MAG TPA: FRG domain-containing protein [Candidatus Acidoferrum sp.]|jgi:hypothetical protein|nr:FRG domain-containing protein [Candidatus Acidoferrum sp.]